MRGGGGWCCELLREILRESGVVAGGRLRWVATGQLRRVATGQGKGDREGRDGTSRVVYTWTLGMCEVAGDIARVGSCCRRRIEVGGEGTRGGVRTAGVVGVGGVRM